jgi:hypothetical protein
LPLENGGGGARSPKDQDAENRSLADVLVTIVIALEAITRWAWPSSEDCEENLPGANPGAK